MTDIEFLEEGSNVVLPNYTTDRFGDRQVARKTYRTYVSGTGGDWDEGGAGQLAFLKEQGLAPTHNFIDIGCGALRAGRHLVDYLEPAHYWGVDANRNLIQIGYDVEFTEEQRAKLPSTHLRANDRFNADFGVKFDMAIAQSVFTHVSLNHMRLCLHRLAKVMKPGGTFFASYIQQPEATPIDHTFQKAEGGRTYFYEKNVFWYHRSDMRWVAEGEPWSFKFVGGYGSAQQQLMVAYTRLTEEEEARKAEREGRKQAERASRQRTNARIAAGGVDGVMLRARRKAAKLIGPY